MNTSLVPLSKHASCPHCGAEEAEIIVYSDTVDFRNMELDVENLHMSKCKNCGHNWTTDEQRGHNNSVMRDAYAVVRDELRRKHGLLSGQEITHLREFFSLNQREAAALFGGGYNAFNKYESGEVLQSYAMDRLLRLTAAVGKPAIGFLKDVFSPPQFVVVNISVSVEIIHGNTMPLRITGTSGAMSLDAPSQFKHFASEIRNQYEKISVIER